MKTRTLLLIVVATIVASCATQETLVPTGGSRADGTVQLSYEYGLFQVPKVDVDQATQAAADRCAAWGYTGAQPFGGQISRCEVFNGYGNCLRTLVTVSFQCTGNPSGGGR
jgi:hypothetical protein